MNRKLKGEFHQDIAYFQGVTNEFTYITVVNFPACFQDFQKVTNCVRLATLISIITS